MPVTALMAAATIRMMIIGSAIWAKKRFMSESFFSAARLVPAVALKAFLRLGAAQAGFAALYVSEYLGDVLAIVLHLPLPPFLNVAKETHGCGPFAISMSLAI